MEDSTPQRAVEVSHPTQTVQVLSHTDVVEPCKGHGAATEHGHH